MANSVDPDQTPGSACKGISVPKLKVITVQYYTRALVIKTLNRAGSRRLYDAWGGWGHNDRGDQGPPRPLVDPGQYPGGYMVTLLTSGK